MPPPTPPIAGIEWRPPVRQGDLYSAALSGPAIIGVTDGYFEIVPTVWHKEILWAMAQGIHVYGSASIGALRAVELTDFGMKGIGHIYRQFHTGQLTDDDEVALLHGPAEIGYVQLTDAMVNVRATIDSALQLGIVEPAFAARLVSIAKSLFYKDRTYETILKAATEQGLAPQVIRRFASWLPGGQVDQKRIDASEMLQAITAHISSGLIPLKVSYEFSHTFAWEEARRRIETAVTRPVWISDDRGTLTSPICITQGWSDRNPMSRKHFTFFSRTPELRMSNTLMFRLPKSDSNFLTRHRIGEHLVFVRFDDVFQWVNCGGEADEFFAGIHVSDRAICNVEFSSFYIAPQTFEAEFNVGILWPVAILVAEIDPSPQISIKSSLIPRRVNKSVFKARAPGRTAHSASRVITLDAIHIGVGNQCVTQFVGEFTQNRQFGIRIGFSRC